MENLIFRGNRLSNVGPGLNPGLDARALPVPNSATEATMKVAATARTTAVRDWFSVRYCYATGNSIGSVDHDAQRRIVVG